MTEQEFFELAARWSVGHLQLLKLIGEGHDSWKLLAEAMSHVPERTLRYWLKQLTGEAMWRDGGWMNTKCPALVQTRKHPHDKGRQFLLSTGGEQILLLSHKALRVNGTLESQAAEFRRPGRYSYGPRARLQDSADLPEPCEARRTAGASED